MSCPNRGIGKKYPNTSYLLSGFYSQRELRMTAADNNSKSNCARSKGFYPSFTPVLSNLSQYTSPAGEYAEVVVTGANMFPFGTTSVDFGGTSTKITFLSPYAATFLIPTSLPSGQYSVRLVNIYNGNFYPPVNQSQAGIPNYSAEIIQYIIT